MAKKILAALLFLAIPALARAESQWILKQATLTYHVIHPLHKANGVSHAARGKGICQDGECKFLIAAPVNSFDSGNSARDNHMLQITRGGEFPMVIVRIQLPEKDLAAPTIHADLHIWFAGQNVEYRQVPLQEVTKGDEMQVSGTIPLKCSDFKIPRPTLLAMPIKNSVPVTVETTWVKQ
jgi:hypothetical protein